MQMRNMSVSCNRACVTLTNAPFMHARGALGRVHLLNLTTHSYLLIKKTATVHKITFNNFSQSDLCVQCRFSLFQRTVWHL